MEDVVGGDVVVVVVGVVDVGFIFLCVSVGVLFVF